MVKDALLVGIGGFVGSVLRHLISHALVSTQWSVAMLGGVLPLSTFTVNAVGSLLIGVFIAAVGQSGWYYLCVVGFCGGFTTFSAFSLELLTLVRGGNWGYAAIYIALSVVICVLAVWLGICIGNKILKII